MRKRAAALLCLLGLLVAPIAASIIGDLNKVNITADGQDVTIRGNLTVLGAFNGSGGGEGTITLPGGETLYSYGDSADVDDLVWQYNPTDDGFDNTSHWRIVYNRTTSDGYYHKNSYQAKNAAGTAKVYFQELLTLDDAANATEDSSVSWSLHTAGAHASEYVWTGTEFRPAADGGNSLGTATYKFSSVNANSVVLDNDESINNSIDGIINVAFDDDAVALGSLWVYSSNEAVEDNNYLSLSFRAKDDAADTTEYAYITAALADVTDISEDGNLYFGLISDGAVAPELVLNGNELYPYVDDGLNLGSAANSYGTLYASSIIQTVDYVFNAGMRAGATAGWVVAPSDDIQHFTLPAGSTDSDLIIPISLPVGFTVAHIGVIGQVESAGNTATLVVNFERANAIAADITTTQVGTTTINFTEDTAIVPDTHRLSVSHVILENSTYYVHISATTAASTDFDLLGIQITGDTI